MNVTLLKKAVKLVLKYPHKLDMNKGIQVGGCKTVGCLAGHVCAVLSKNSLRGAHERLCEPYSISYGEVLWSKVEGVASDALGIDERQRGALFQLGAWPLKFKLKYCAATSFAARARVLAQRVNHFIRTGGAE